MTRAAESASDAASTESVMDIATAGGWHILAS